MLTAAKASLPIPFPTKIPSVITNTAENIIPKTVGINNFLNKVEMFMLPKSILSLIFLFFEFRRKGKANYRVKNYQMITSRLFSM